MCIRSHNHYVEPLELRNCIVIYIALRPQVLEGLYRLVVECAYLRSNADLIYLYIISCATNEAMHLLLLLFPSHSFRIDLANTVANAAGVPLGNVLVYDVVQFNYSQEACLSAILRFTGASGEYQAEQWVGLSPQVVDRAIISRSGRGS